MDPILSPRHASIWNASVYPSGKIEASYLVGYWLEIHARVTSMLLTRSRTVLKVHSYFAVEGNSVNAGGSRSLGLIYLVHTENTRY